MSLGTSPRADIQEWGRTRSSSTFVIVPKPFCSILYNNVVTETWPVVIEKSEFVRREDVCCGLSVEFCPDFCQTSLEKVCEALVNATVTILSDVNSLSKRDLAVAGYVFQVTTHVVDDERRVRLRVILQRKDSISISTTEGNGFRRQQEWEEAKWWSTGVVGSGRVVRAGIIYTKAY
jgi:hypothetical protein